MLVDPDIFSYDERPAKRDSAHAVEVAVARALFCLLEDSLARADLASAADVSDQLAHHLRRIRHA